MVRCFQTVTLNSNGRRQKKTEGETLKQHKIKCHCVLAELAGHLFNYFHVIHLWKKNLRSTFLIIKISVKKKVILIQI